MVSIIVPLYNAEKHIRQCLESLLNQTVRDIEIIVVNDGATDNSQAIVARMADKDPRIRMFSQENRGVSTARNKGLSEAAGEYVCFVDADDYVESTMIEKLLQITDEKTLGVCNFFRTDSQSPVLSNMFEVKLICFDTSFVEGYLSGDLAAQIVHSSCNKMFSINTIRANHITFPVGITVGEDMLFVLQYLACVEAIRCVDEGLFYYRIHVGSTMNMCSRNYLPEYDITINKMKEMQKAGFYISDLAIAKWAMTIIPIILSSRYVTTMSFKHFKEFYADFRDSLLSKYAMRAENPHTVKLRIFRALFNANNVVGIFLMIKLNNWLHSLGW